MIFFFCGLKPLLCVVRAVTRVVDPAGNCYSGSVARRMTEIKPHMLVRSLERQRNFRHILEKPIKTVCLFVCLFVCIAGLQVPCAVR